MWLLLARLVQASMARAGIGTAAGRVALGTGAIVTGDLTLDWLRQQALNIAPGSDAAALEEAARMVWRLLGMDNDDVFWGRQKNGQPIPPNYITIDLNRGKAWVSSRYHSGKSVRGGFRRGFGRGRSSRGATVRGSFRV